MSAVKHQPATPLPWRWKIGAEGGCALHSGQHDGKQTLVLLTVARRGNLSIAPKRGDTDYIAHAANAYPKLVEALRAAREGMRHAINPVGGDAKCAEILRIDSMLRELGEEA